MDQIKLAVATDVKKQKKNRVHQEFFEYVEFPNKLCEQHRTCKVPIRRRT